MSQPEESSRQPPDPENQIESNDHSEVLDDSSSDTTSEEIQHSPEGCLNWRVMPPDDLLDLTMCSNDLKQKVRTLLLGITRITFNDGQLAICVSNRDFDNDETRIDLEIVQQESLPSKLTRITSYLRSRIWRKFVLRKINGMDYEVEKINHNDYGIDLTFDGFNYRVVNFRKEFIIYTHDTTTAHENVLRHVFFVFANPTPLFYLDLRGIQSENFDVPTKLVGLYDQCRQCTCLAIGVRKNEFVEQAHKTLEMMTELKNLNIDISLTETEFFSPRMCQIDHLNVVYHKNAISEKNLLSLNCETIKLWSVTITATALNLFIKKWLKSTKKRFRYLEIPIIYLDPDDSDQNEIMKDLNVKKFDDLQRAVFYKRYDWNYELNCTGQCRYINCRNGLDITRSDGALATIVSSTSFFYFFVWHERFPEQPKDHVPFCDD
ncbi:hypothetical protein GCK72_002053 [Caenorhabditis remanei]|uniref:Sdz-33 F-box domain-containing protein n=1 Tax=Caenorhabditis remanei TaxID=31234 RepID=A0A6A5HRJ5_CAERE|nr:hypothetical protein GCK72_002053 [Caenorhabditis remanei]KAF1770235.1 hypothetical protein GCK72_002053 [Caenorhabditis remanei]